MSDRTLLGCGENRLVIFDRCATRQVCDLTDNLSSLTYGRVMDDTSGSVGVISLAGQGDANCCSCIRDMRTWINSGVIVRDGEVVWGPGPVTNILTLSETATITIRDISAWLDVRVIHGAYSFVATPVLEIARQIIVDAMSPDDPCGVVDNLKIIQPPVGTEILIDKVYEAEKQYAGDALRDLAASAIDFTVVGRSIILSQNLEFGPFGLLTDDDFLTELEIEERGVEAGTRWIVNGEEAVSGSAGGVDPFYGLIEQIADADDNITDSIEATASAINRVAGSNPAPLYINIPDGAQLSPEAPTSMGELIPGSLYNVYINDMCRTVSQSSRLTAMSVSTKSGEEQIGVTLSPRGIDLVIPEVTA